MCFSLFYGSFNFLGSYYFFHNTLNCLLNEDVGETDRSHSDIFQGNLIESCRFNFIFLLLKQEILSTVFVLSPKENRFSFALTLLVKKLFEDSKIFFIEVLSVWTFLTKSIN